MWDILQRSKDLAVELGARAFLNHKLRQFGEVTELSLDSKTRSIRVRLDLRGERAPIDVVIGRYALVDCAGAPHIVIEEASASREWLTIALKEFVVGRPFPLPEKADAILKLL